MEFKSLIQSLAVNIDHDLIYILTAMKKSQSEYIKYEIFTRDLYQSIISDEGFEKITVFHNGKLCGKSGSFHQIDVYWYISIAGVQQLFCIECKNWNKRVEKNNIVTFKGILEDLSAKGIYISKKGYQSGAAEYAQHHGIEILTGSFTPKTGEAWMDISMPQFHKINVMFDSPLQGIYCWDEAAEEPAPEDLPIYNENGELTGNLNNILESFNHCSDGDYLQRPDNLFLLGDDGLKKIHEIKYFYMENKLLPKPLIGTYNFIEAVTRKIDGLVKYQKNFYNVEFESPQFVEE